MNVNIKGDGTRAASGGLMPSVEIGGGQSIFRQPVQTICNNFHVLPYFKSGFKKIDG